MNEYQNEYDLERSGKEQQTELKRLKDRLAFLQECASGDSEFMKTIAILTEDSPNSTSVGRAYLLNMIAKLIDI